MSGINLISNAFLRKDFQESYPKLQNQIKKVFENTLEANQTHNIGDVSCYSSDYEDEEIFTNKNTLKITVKNEEIEVPADIVKIEDIHDILNQEVFDSLTEEEKEHLLSYLPRSVAPEKTLEDLFSGKAFFHTNPLETFFEQAKAGCYTKTFQKEKEIETRLSNIYLRNYYENMANLVNIKLEDDPNNLELHQQMSNLIKRSAVLDLESISQDSDVSIDSINDIKVENSLDEISEGETVLEKIEEDIKMEIMPTIDDELVENRKFEAQRALAITETFRPKKPETDPMISSMSASKNSKTTKNILTIKLSSREWIDRFREQERDRYNNPTRPWTFHLPDGTTAIVAPVAKKISTGQNSKPREHFLLKPDRPSYITILCLVRDAAARLPSGEGTRADICELLKESQYINETIPDDRVNTVVSGALDRLHYEDDPCVKYDSDKKLWVYLHRDRTEDYGPWLDQSESRSSKKKEYNMKYKVKKKLKAEEQSGAPSETDGAPNDNI